MCVYAIILYTILCVILSLCLYHLPKCFSVYILLYHTTAIYHSLECHAGVVPGERTPHKIGKNKIFWRKIVIFHTKYPNNFRASLRSVQFF